MSYHRLTRLDSHRITNRQTLCPNKKLRLRLCTSTQEELHWDWLKTCYWPFLSSFVANSVKTLPWTAAILPWHHGHFREGDSGSLLNQYFKEKQVLCFHAGPWGHSTWRWFFLSPVISYLWELPLISISVLLHFIDNFLLIKAYANRAFLT